MIPILTTREELNLRLQSRKKVSGEDSAIVKKILSAVLNQGDQALREFTEKYDGVLVDSFRINKKRLAEAEKELDLTLRKSIQSAIENIRRFHKPQIPKHYSIIQPDGTKAEWRWRSIRRIGIYVPGGRYPLLSTLMMNVIPAREAGVKEIAVCTPPGSSGLPAPQLLAVCNMLGIEEVYRIGGAQAIAALSYGTESIPAVDKITGPGNAYVTAAKLAVSHQTGIDMAAGPTEVVIIADGSAKAKWVAADLISQAEHDPLASAILLTDSATLANEVTAQVESLTKPLSTNKVIESALEKNGFIYLADSIAACVDISNTIAPEHLSLQIKNSEDWTNKVIAGAIFLGSETPVAWGDYWAGPNHTLPTLGQARFRGPLNVLDFMVPYSIINANRAISAQGTQVMKLAQAEGLAGHSLSIKLRMDNDEA